MARKKAAKKTKKSERRVPAPVTMPERSAIPERELVVIARPEAGLLAAVEGVTAAAADVTPLVHILSEVHAELRPLFGVREDRLRFEASTLAAAGGVTPPDLSIYYRVVAPTENLEALASQLREQETIEAAYVKPPSELPQLNEMTAAPEEPPSHTPDFSARQGYLDPAPGGIDARYAWTQAGGDGAGVRIIDIEGAWRFGHEDLLQNQGGVIGGTQSTDMSWRNHGTAVVGEFSGDQNTLGVTGICPQANVRAISIFPTGSMGSAAAIRQAANALNPGDIILIELHRAGPRFNFQPRADQRGYIAIEWWPDDFDAILFATGRGVIVVEAAGNGAENLDDPLYNTAGPGFPTSWRNSFNRANRDSGALMVGAGAPPPGTHGRNWGADRSRLGFSNFGSAVDAQGWGREVTSCGYGDLQGGANEDEWYTDQFSGTSSASPIVVGALSCLQGIVRARSRPVLTPAQARQLLRTTGTAQQDGPGMPTTQRIGNRPDLRQLIAQVTKLKEKLEGKEARKLEKIESKELKREKIEKRELKELKGENIEKMQLKEWKREKIEGKELKEKEFKEHKPEIEGKGPQDIQGWRQFGRVEGGVVFPRAGGESLEARLDYLERAIEELAHLMAGGMNPELNQHTPDG